MPTTAATSCITVPVDLLADLVSSRSSWISWTKSANAAEAKKRVFQIGGNMKPVYERPVAIVGLLLPWRWAIDTGRFTGGGLFLIVEDDMDPTEITSGDHAQGFRTFGEKMGALVKDLADALRAAGTLWITDMQLTDFGRTDPKEGDQYYQSHLRFSFGTRGAI